MAMVRRGEMFDGGLLQVLELDRAVWRFNHAERESSQFILLSLW